MGAPGNHGTPRPGLLPGCAVDADTEWAQYVAWLDREAAAGREPEPWPGEEAEPWDQGPEDPTSMTRLPLGHGGRCSLRTAWRT